MEIIKDDAGKDQLAIRVTISISHTCEFQDAIIYIPALELKEMLDYHYSNNAVTTVINGDDLKLIIDRGFGRPSPGTGV